MSEWVFVFKLVVSLGDDSWGSLIVPNHHPAQLPATCCTVGSAAWPVAPQSSKHYGDSSPYADIIDAQFF